MQAPILLEYLTVLIFSDISDMERNIFLFETVQNFSISFDSVIQQVQANK